MELKMKRINIPLCATVAVAVVLAIPAPARAQNAAATLYKTKCAACHGPDGSGSVVGTKLGTHDFRSPEVQTQSDAALTAIITNGKNKMPAYQKTLKSEEITGLIAFIRTLAPGK
jgi:mono/diheme cytochrome c family protein